MLVCRKAGIEVNMLQVFNQRKSRNVDLINSQSQQIDIIIYSEWVLSGYGYQLPFIFFIFFLVHQYVALW